MVQGHKIEALLFELCKYTKTRLKLIKMDNFSNLYIYGLHLYRIKGIYFFMPKKARSNC